MSAECTFRRDSDLPNPDRRGLARAAVAMGAAASCLALIAIATAPILAQTAPVLQQKFSDSFELTPYWTITEQFGSLELVSAPTHSGGKALKLSSVSGGQRYVVLTHSPQANQGTISVWFYDTAPGLQTLYAGLYAHDSTLLSNNFSVAVADWNASTYVWSGPGIGQTATSVPRTAGWHEFTLRVTSTAYDALIDQVVVGSVAGNFTFDTTYLSLSGPSFRPDATYYYDDFSFTPNTPVPLGQVRRAPRPH